jgi:hypothetical protein
MSTWNGSRSLRSKVLNDLQDAALTKAGNKIGENCNHTSKNKSLLYLLNRCLIEFTKSLAVMRDLQESTLVSNDKYRVSFIDEEEAGPFQLLREKLAKLVKASTKLDFRTVPTVKKDQNSVEYDKSFEEQQQDTSYIGDLIPRNTPRRTDTELVAIRTDPKRGSLDQNFLEVGSQPMVIDGTKATIREVMPSVKSVQKVIKVSATSLGSRKQSLKISHSQLLKNQSSLAGLKSNKQLSTSAHKVKSVEINIEDAELFASNLKQAPQRMVQRRRCSLSQTLNCTISCHQKHETHFGKKWKSKNSRETECTWIESLV